MGAMPQAHDEGDENVAERGKKSVVLMTGTQMERPLRHLSGLIREYANDEYEVDILNLGTKAGVYEHKDGGYPAELRQEIIDFLVDKKPVVLGITMIDFGVERLSDLIRDIAENEEIKKIGTKIIAGGPFAIEHSERCIGIEGIDIVCYSKGWNFPDIVDACISGDPKTIPGLMLKTGVDEDGKPQFVQTPPPNLRITFADQPLPDERHENTNRIYEGHLVNEEKSGGAIPVEHHQVPHEHTAVLIISEGCPNDCEFCSIPKQQQAMAAQVMRFSKNPLEFTGESEVLAGAKNNIPKFKFLDARKAIDLVKNYLKENPKTEYVLFNDNDFTARSEQKIEEFCRLYKEEVGLPFYCQCSPNTASQRKINLLHEAGMDTFDTGVQGSQEANTHAGYERNCTDEQILDAARSVASHLEKRNEQGEVTEEGLKAAFDFINGNEIHTKEDMLSTIVLSGSLTRTIDKLTDGKGSWNLAIHNLTLDQDRDLAREYRKRKEATGDVSVGEVEDSDYHNATVEEFYKLGEPYLNIVLEWMGGLHDQVQSGRLPRKTENFATLIQEVLASEPDFAALIDKKKDEKPETVGFLTDEDVYAFLGGKDNDRAKAILKKISEKIPNIHYSYQRPNRYDYDYSWAEEQINPSEPAQ